MGSEFRKSDENKRNRRALDVECVEARLDVIETRVDRFGKTIQELQKELNAVQMNMQKPDMSDTLDRTAPQDRTASKAATSVFPWSTRRLSVPGNQHDFGNNFVEGNITKPDTGTPSKLLQKPTTFDGSSLWESYYAQFEIVASLNGWDDYQKAAYLATSLKGPALAVLGNLSTGDRHNLDALVSALKNRFGTSHQTELSRMKFKNRVKQRDESLPELAEDIERLSRLSYPDAPSMLRDVLARDQFVDALLDEDTRLRIKQERPQTLRRALETALELESFNIAA